jgi:hypothetical protein
MCGLNLNSNTPKLVTSVCCGVVSYKGSHVLRLFSVLLCDLIWALIIPDSSARALSQIAAETPNSEAGRKLARNVD